MLPALKRALAERDEETRAATVRHHGGFYLRLGMGAGYLVDTAQVGSIETKSKGLGLSVFDLGVGLTFDSVVVGYGFAFLVVASPNTTIDGSSIPQDHSAAYSLIGLLVDFYPSPRRGLHFGFTLGAGSADINRRKYESTSSGLGVLLGGGYDFWVSDQWSLGVMGRLLYIGGADDDFGNHRVWAPVLTASALWH